MNFLHLIQQLLYYWIQKFISYLIRAILVVVIIVLNSKKSYFYQHPQLPLTVHKIFKLISVNLATIYFKAPQLAELGSATQFVIGTLCCMEMTIPFLFYHYSKRYIYSVQVENKNEENEKFLIESLSPTMWGTKKTEFTSNDIRYRSKMSYLL